MSTVTALIHNNLFILRHSIFPQVLYQQVLASRLFQDELNRVAVRRFKHFHRGKPKLVWDYLRVFTVESRTFHLH